MVKITSEWQITPGQEELETLDEEAIVWAFLRAVTLIDCNWASCGDSGSYAFEIGL